MITPTVGRVVLFTQGLYEGPSRGGLVDYSHALAAIITHVHSDTCVNLAVFDAIGLAHARTDVALVQDGDIRPEGCYCEWMPYQKGQAAKTEDVTGALSARVAALERIAGTEIVLKSAAFDFGAALVYLRAGRSVRRAGWNGKGLKVTMQLPDAHSKMTLPYLYIEYPSNNEHTPGARCPWLASQTDILATDWSVVP